MSPCTVTSTWVVGTPEESTAPHSRPERSPAPTRAAPRGGVYPLGSPDEDFYADEDEFAVFADEGSDDE
jgi:hypothetical protein